MAVRPNDEADGPDLATLIGAHQERTKESFRAMARRSDDRVHHQSLQGWATQPPRGFPKKQETFEALARILDTDVTTVLLAFARSLGLDVRGSGPDESRVLPPVAERLTDRQRDVLLSVLDVMVGPEVAEPAAGADRARLRRVARKGGRGQQRGR